MSSSTATPSASGTAFAGPPSPPRAGPQTPSPPQSSAGAASDAFGSTNSLHAADGDGWHDADGDGADVQVDWPASFANEPYTIRGFCRCTPTRKHLLKAGADLLDLRCPTGVNCLVTVHVMAICGNTRNAVLDSTIQAKRQVVLHASGCMPWICRPYCIP